MANMLIQIGDKKIEISSANNLKSAKLLFDQFGHVESIETIDIVDERWILTAAGLMIGHMPVGIYDDGE